MPDAQLIGPDRLERVLGTGSFATVWLAFDGSRCWRSSADPSAASSPVGTSPPDAGMFKSADQFAAALVAANPDWTGDLPVPAADGTIDTRWRASDGRQTSTSNPPARGAAR